MRSMTKTKRSAAQPVGGVRHLTRRLLPVLALGLLALGGCGDLQPVASFEPETDVAKLYGSLTLDHRAINLSTVAPYDTVQLTATPRNLRGEPMQGLPAPTFRSSDTVAVWVTPDGLVQAREATSGVRVIAEVVTGDNVRHVDTAYVKVTSNATPPELASLEITFASPEQAQLPMTTIGSQLPDIIFGFAGLPSPTARAVSVAALDGAGNPVSGLEIDYVSLDPDNVVVNRRSGVVEQVVGPPGEEVAIIARTTAYGVVVADTATFTVMGPMANALAIQPGVDGAPYWIFTDVVIRPGGVVALFYTVDGGAPLGITFDDPTAVEAIPGLCSAFGGFMPHFCGSGDIAAFPGLSDLLQGARFRQFPEPGVYEFEATDGVQGRVRVVEDDDPFWDAMRSGE